MKYTKEEYNFIKNWLNKCVSIKKDNCIYYVTSPNILRQLKYNRLYSKNKEVKVDLNKLNYKDNIILEQDLKNKRFWINYYIIWSIFESKYNYNYDEIKKLINDILGDIINLTEYTTNQMTANEFKTLGDIINLTEYTTHRIRYHRNTKLGDILNLKEYN